MPQVFEQSLFLLLTKVRNTFSPAWKVNFSEEAALAFKFSSVRLRLKLLEKTESGNCGLSIQTKGKEMIQKTHSVSFSGSGLGMKRPIVTKMKAKAPATMNGN